MQYSDIKNWAGKEDFNAYDMLLLRMQLGEEEEFIRCLSLTCTAGQFPLRRRRYSPDHLSCLWAKQCYQHRSVWHEGYTCTQWDEEQKLLSRANETSHQVIQSITKPCPGPSCGKRIQKVDGCDHMTCKPPGGCGFEFCWLCLAPYEPIRRYDNSRHYDHCDYYSGAPGGNPAPSSIRNAPSTSAPTTAPTRQAGLVFDLVDSDEGMDSDDSGARFTLRLGGARVVQMEDGESIDEDHDTGDIQAFGSLRRVDDAEQDTDEDEPDSIGGDEQQPENDQEEVEDNNDSEEVEDDSDPEEDEQDSPDLEEGIEDDEAEGVAYAEEYEEPEENEEVEEEIDIEHDPFENGDHEDIDVDPWGDQDPDFDEEYGDEGFSDDVYGDDGYDSY